MCLWYHAEKHVIFQQPAVFVAQHHQVHVDGKHDVAVYCGCFHCASAPPTSSVTQLLGFQAVTRMLYPLFIILRDSCWWLFRAMLMVSSAGTIYGFNSMSMYNIVSMHMLIPQNSLQADAQLFNDLSSFEPLKQPCLTKVQL